VVVQEPRLAEHVGVFGLGDMITLDGQLHVVANTAAKGAGSVLDDFDFLGHEHILDVVPITDFT
jgi:hypothetical protein